MATKTRAELAQRALEKLLVVGAGQSPDSEDTERVDGVIDAVLADLEARQIVTVADVEEIELAVFEWIADILADSVAPDFGQGRDANKRAFAEAMLVRIGSSGPTRETLHVDYF